MITAEYSVEDLFSAGPQISLPLQTTLAHECGKFILIDDLLQTYRPSSKRMAMNLLDEEVEHISVAPASLERGVKFIEKILWEAKNSSSRYALELRSSLNVGGETLVRNFKRFAKYCLEQKLERV